MADFCDLVDFEARYGTVDDAADQAAVEELLDDAQALILDVADGSDAAWVSDPESADVPRSVLRVCRDVAYRAWSNPDALSQMSMGNTALSYTREGIADALFLTAREQKTIVTAASQSSMRAVTLVSPYSGDES